LGLFPQFKSSEGLKTTVLPIENGAIGGLISELLSESNFEDTNANQQMNVRDNLKNMLLQMQ
jgi:hypothetical protein